MAWRQKRAQQKSIITEISSREMVNNLCHEDMCKGAGVIPYTIIGGKVYFLLQKNINGAKSRQGWSDFGGKKSFNKEIPSQIASREFSEETSCLFYLKELMDNNYYDKINSTKDEISYEYKIYREIYPYYRLLKKNDEYSNDTINRLKEFLPHSQSYFYKKINLTSQNEPCILTKGIYVTYLMYVPYISANELPSAEDLHIPYKNRFLRTCKWFDSQEILNMAENEFNSRLRSNYLKKLILTMA